MKDALLCDDNTFVVNTTLHHNIAFVPYTTKDYFEKHTSTSYQIFIEVYQLQIGNTKYIDIASVNDLQKSELKKHVIVPAVIVPAVIIVIFILIMRIAPLRKRLSKLF